MEPIIANLIKSLVTSLGKRGLEGVFEYVSEKASDKALGWIKRLLFKGNNPKQALKELQDDPENESKQQTVRAIVQKSIEDNKMNLEYLMELTNLLNKNQQMGNSYKNINKGTIKSKKGNIHIGDKHGE